MGSFRFVGYAIVSGDGMLAAADGIMPASLKFAGDQRFFEAGLDDADLIVHGRNSHENQPRSAQRRRLILTRTVERPVQAPDNPQATLWNPVHATFEEATAAAGVGQGKVAPIGGTDVFSMFLDRYETFWLSQAPHVRLPGGVPVFHGVPLQSPQEILHAHGLRPGAPIVLDEKNAVTVVGWTRG